MRPETVMIETDNGPVMINKTDYDPNTHTLADVNDMPLPIAEPVPAAAAVPTGNQTPVAVDANGNPVNVGDGGQFVPPVAPALRTDGPTVAEFVAAGYDPANYPPTGYESRSTPEEITAAIEAYVPPTSTVSQSVTAENGGTTAPADGKPALPEMFVTPAGKKHFVTSQDGSKITDVEGIDAKGYATSEAAWAAVMKVKQGG